MPGTEVQRTTATHEPKGLAHGARPVMDANPLARLLGNSRGIASMDDAVRLLGDPALATRANRNVRVAILREVQGKFGDRAAQQVAMQAKRSATPGAPGTGGTPLAPAMRSRLEGGLGANLGGVRVHQGAHAAKAATQLGSKAFAFGQNIVLGPTARADDLALMAHEAAHTIQQSEGGAEVQHFTTAAGGAHEAEARQASDAVTRGERFAVSGRTGRAQVQRADEGGALNYIAEQANIIPGFRMLTVIIGFNPVNMHRVERSGANILRALIELMPGGSLITTALEGYGIFERVGAWAEKQAAAFANVGGEIKAALSAFLGTLKWTDIFDFGGVWERAKAIFAAPIARLKAFAAGLVADILKFIKDAILHPLARLAEKTDGYALLKGVLGEDPITGEPVPRNAETLVAPFLKLIGQEEVWENMKKANAIPRIWKWFQGALVEVKGYVAAIPTLFVSTLQSLQLEDVILPPKAWIKIGTAFGGFVGKFAKWAGGALWKLLEIIFDCVSPGAWGYIQKTGAALRSIIKNPLPFIGNLVKAAKLGFTNFAGNILEHLKAGLINWLVGAVPGVYIPKKFELSEIVKFVFSVLGISWANIRQKLVKATSETAVKAMETGFDIVVTLVRDGPAAAWDKIKEHLSDLQTKVIGGITDFVIDSIVKKAVPKLIAMFIPGAGFISAIMSIYDTVMVFVNRMKEIALVIKGFIDSIVAIASGAIDGAAKKVESILASILSLAIGFLAGFIGLGNVSDKVKGVLETVRATIDKALDAVIKWIVTSAKKLFAKAFGKGKDGKTDERTSEAKAHDLRLAVEEGTVVADAHGDDLQAIRTKLAPIQRKYGLVKLDVANDGGIKHHLVGEINPTYVGKIFTAANQEELLAKIPAGAKSDVRAAIKEATDKQKVVQRVFDTALAKGFVRPRKTMALADDVTISGWGDLRVALDKLVKGNALAVSQETAEVHNFVVANAAGLKGFGYETKGFIFDPKYAPGAYFKSHAEKQAFIAALQRLEAECDTAKKKAIASIGVTRPMCPDDCFPFFNAVAQLQSRTIVLADPAFVWVFLPNGDVIQKTLPATKK